MFQRTIKLSNLNLIYGFNQRIQKVRCDVDMMSVSRKYVVDAKSLMGIMSLDLTVPVVLRAYTEDAEVVQQIKNIIEDLGIGGDAK